ncbi:MAG: hypothetical protein ACFCVD_23245 [Nodosilinea sp.]
MATVLGFVGGLCLLNTILFFLARQEQNRKIFTFGEWFAFSLILIAALSALYGFSAGLITI